jgi:hypothetical protein
MPVQQHAKPSAGLKHNWRESDSETLWTTRYNNCDYGYYVLLDAGVVAHDTLPPSPNHGFLISLSDIGKTTFASYETEKRYVWVDAHYDSLDDQSLIGAADTLQKTETANSVLRHNNRVSTKLAGLPAIEDTFEDSTPKGEPIEESIVAVRSGIVYTIGLQTLKAYKAADEKQFRQIRDGFRLLRLPKGECSNG